MRGTSKREDNVFWTIVLGDTKKGADDKRGARFVSRFTKPSETRRIIRRRMNLVTDSATGQVGIH